jgi:hypothetical protein
MAEISTFYKGFLITYDENSDNWHCDILQSGRLSLKRAKRGIDSWLRTKRIRKTLDLISFEDSPYAKFGEIIKISIPFNNSENKNLIGEDKDGTIYRWLKENFPDTLIPIIDHNKIILRRIQIIFNNKKQMDVEIDQLKSKLIKYNFDKLVEKVKRT